MTRRVALTARILMLIGPLLTALLALILAGVLGLLALIVLALVRLAFGHVSFSCVEPSNAPTTSR
jgi:uncharacterized membrane protein